jgi:hypothetical protein
VRVIGLRFLPLELAQARIEEGRRDFSAVRLSSSVSWYAAVIAWSGTSRGVLALMLGDRARGELALRHDIAERNPQVFASVRPAEFLPTTVLADDPAHRALLEASGTTALLQERAARVSGAAP